MNKRIVLTLAYAAAILALSSIPGSSFPSGKIFTYDKVIHFVEYMGFAIFLSEAFEYKRSIVLVISVAILFGAFDEAYQSIIPGRDLSVADWIADSLGSGAGAYLMYWRNTLR